MWLNGKYLTETEVAAYIDQIERENKKLKQRIERIKQIYGVDTETILEHTGAIE